MKDSAAYLQSQKPGAAIHILVGGKPTEGKFRSYAPGASSFSLTVNRKITWAQLAHLIIPGEIPEAAVSPATDKAPALISELAQSVINALSTATGPVLVSGLAAALNLPMLKLAATLGAMGRKGLIEGHGEGKKGGKSVELTEAGRAYTTAPVVEFTPLPVHVEAMESVGVGGGEVVDIFVANAITEIHSAHPHLLSKTPPQTADAYFRASLTPDGSRYAMQWRHILNMDAAPTPPKAAPKPSKRPATGTKPRPAPTVRTGTGRAGGARKSLREIVLDAIAQLADGVVGYREVVASLASSTELTKLQLQNAAFKLVGAGFLVADENGRVASPVALTERGRAGYGTRHGGGIRAQVEPLVAAGYDDKAISIRVGCEPSYVYDVRTNRRIKAKEAAE